jgi:hypothetical protein
MRRAQAGLVAVAGIAVAALAAPSLPLARASQSQEDQPLEAAGRAAAQVTFSGSLEVRWSDDNGDHHQILSVQGADGLVVVRGSTEVMASRQQRLVEHSGGTWDLLWPVDQGSAPRPPTDRKYQLVSSVGPQLIGRQSQLVEVRMGGQLLERLYTDTDTGILLRREQFENGEGPYRTIAFDSISFQSGAPPEAPGPVVNMSPKMIAANHIPGGVSAPVALADGYQRVGIYKRTGVTQVVYSDGLYDLSVFQQAGRLDHHDLSSAGRVPVGTASGWHYAWPGGHVVLWEAGGTVYTAVSDAPLDQVLGAVRTIPPARASASLLSRLRQACRALIQPLGA